MNSLVIVGRIFSIREENNYTRLKIAVNRAYKSEDGYYDTDIIPIKLKGSIAKKTIEYCKKGDLIGIKGMLETENNRLIVNASKVSFMQTSGNYYE